MPTIAETLEAALALHRAGNLDQADGLYRHILQAEPAHADALHLLGLIAHQRGRNDAAIEYLRQALAAEPHEAVYRFNLGCIYKASKNLEEAAACFRDALLVRPDYPEAYRNLANTVAEQCGADDAARAYRPESAPSNYSFGNMLSEQGKTLDAVLFFRQAIRLDPEQAEAHCNLGRLLQEAGHLDGAAACYHKSIRLRPDALPYHNLGTVYWQQGRSEEALACCNEALRLNPGAADAHFLRANLRLLQGDFEQGWPEYEWRMRLPEMQTFRSEQPQWDGAPLAGRTILLRAEQGFGDTLQFVRYAALVKQQGGTVLLDCPTEVARILRTCAGIDEVVTPESPAPAFDVQAPLLSLPATFKTTLATVPATIPYLAADPSLMKRWRHELSPHSHVRIGIIWQGNPRLGQPECRLLDKRRSIPLVHFEPLARIPGVQLFSLQKGYGTEQLAECKDRIKIIDLAERLHDFMDTAGLMMQLDLIVSADTSGAHLAGALGRRVWTILPYANCWRWLKDRRTSPWYPTMRLFRQTTAGNWSEVFERLGEKIRSLAQRLRST